VINQVEVVAVDDVSIFFKHGMPFDLAADVERPERHIDAARSGDGRFLSRSSGGMTAF